VSKRNALTLSETYGARLEAFDLLRSASEPRGGDPAALRRVATSLDGAAATSADPEV